MCHVPGPRGISPRYFCPRRASSQYLSQAPAPGASRSQHRLSSFLPMKNCSRSYCATGCVNTNFHRPTSTRNQELLLSEVEERIGRVQAQTHTCYPSFGGGFSPLILNRIPLLEIRVHTSPTDRMPEPSFQSAPRKTL